MNIQYWCCNCHKWVEGMMIHTTESYTLIMCESTECSNIIVKIKNDKSR